MSRLDTHLPPPRLSVLDRLLAERGDEAGSEQDYDAVLRRLTENVRRDLAWLLNARTWRVQDDGDPLTRSIERFGVADMTTVDMKNDEEQAEIARRIATAIERFEPRLSAVEVTCEEVVDPEARTRFKIEALLRLDPEPRRLQFDTTILWRNRRVRVE